MATDTPNTGRDSDKFMLRFPEGMRDRLKEAAKSNNRTMNAEILARLEQSFSSVSSPAGARSFGLEIAKATLENQLMELMIEQGYEKINLLHADECLGKISDKKSSLSQLKRRALEAERETSKRRYEALVRKIDSVMSLANRQGIHLSPEELNAAGYGGPSSKDVSSN